MISINIIHIIVILVITILRIPKNYVPHYTHVPLVYIQGVVIQFRGCALPEIRGLCCGNCRKDVSKGLSRDVISEENEILRVRDPFSSKFENSLSTQQ